MSGKEGMLKGFIKKTCSKCENFLDRKGKYCKSCHTKYMRKWRKIRKEIDSDVDADEKYKNMVRSKVNMRVKRGLMDKYPCEICGDTKVEAHHDDYNKPYCVRWLCCEHHREVHRKLRENG